MQQLGDSFPLTANIITADAPSVSAKMLSSYSLPIDGWKPIMNNLEEGRSFERVNPGLETITLSADTQTDPAVFADYTTDVDMTNFSIGYHLDGVAARFITEIARQVLPNIYVPTETGQQLELACAEITTRNKQGQELKNRVAIRSTKTFSMTIMYADETMLWDQTVWDKLMGTLVIPGSFEQSDHESNAPLLVDSSVQQPAVTSMTDTSPVAVEQFQGLAVTESPHLQPVASPILPITPPSSNKSPIIIAIIAVFVLVALVVGGIIIFRSVLWPSTISDEAISRLGQDRLGVVESGKSVAIGETVQTQTYEFKVDKIAGTGKEKQ